MRTPQLPRALVVTPNRDDARLSIAFLSENHIEASAYDSLAQLSRGLPEDAGCIVVVEEALAEADLRGFREILEQQPSWSELPLVLVSGGSAGLDTLVERAFPNAGNVTLLERPFNPLTLVSAVRVGLRARARQLEARDLLQAREEALRQRDDFLAMLAHELRNPLAPMRNAVYLMKKPNVAPAMNSKSIQILERQITHMARMVDDLLDVARLERGRIELKKQRVNLSASVRAAADACLALTRARGHRVVMQLDDPLYVDADPVRLEQLLTNLVVNAAKFMPNGGEIELRTAREGEKAFVSVRDGGIGIRPEMIESVFSPFVQDDRSLARSAGGLGIGLSIARRVAELHGGSLRARSEGLNKGAVFEARFPLASMAVPEPLPEPALPAGIPSPRRVLVIEDNDDIRESLSMVLKDWGHEVMLAKTGDEGLTMALQGRPDVALIDIGLPGRSGYDVALEIRAKADIWSARVRLIAVTGYGQPSDRDRAIGAGFNGHLLKPVDPELLSHAIAQS